ncbi:Pentatricopeptide repeat-containing protein, mitochondrial [Ananas comosus]|uniref:Pentatricopeptide repeat-containing protein, mitochondrial n=1 Tax=Ananas comosus TaxID=4615 RepID=A0A199VPV2_ANACO|nr:Pentatricopeptide repeat-containing protein, mitochondrial [Ananas comosus]
MPRLREFLARLGARRTSPAATTRRPRRSAAAADADDDADPIRRHNRALAELIRGGRVRAARRLFEALPARNVVTWNSMVTAYARRRELAEARHLFDRMPQRDVVSWNSVLSGYALSLDPGELAEGRRLFDRMPQRDVVSWNTMVGAYARNGRLDDAMRLFDEMPQRNAVSWNTMITGFLGAGEVRRAVKMFERMPERDAASLSALVSGLIRNGRSEEAEKLLLSTHNVSEIEGAVDAYNTLIAGYGRSGRVGNARRLFDMIPMNNSQEEKCGERIFERNVVSWNSMIMCYVKANDLQSARILFDEMPSRDLVSWNTMISGYIQAMEMEHAEYLFNQMPHRDAISWNLMICGFTQKGDIARARELFDNMPNRSLISWNAMISGYEQNGDYEGALVLFSNMQGKLNEKPDRHTLSSVLGACAGLAMLHLGSQIHQLVTKTFVPDIPISNSLITMYSRCGILMDAKAIFDSMETCRDVVSWNAMIGGYAHHGHAQEALDLFERMKKMNMRPTHITFISLLNSCGHAGLVAEGKRVFDSMVHEFGIEPQVEHYASLVDLIGRHGQLEEAMQVINGMAISPDQAVWGAFLGACRVHNNAPLAQVAAEVLVEIEPESSAPYVLLHNLHVDEGRWESAGEVREKMEKSGVVKQPGYSWIEVHNIVHLFVSGDTTHPLSREIYSLIESCNRFIRDVELD